MSVICLPGVVRLHESAPGLAKPDHVVETAMGRIRLSLFRDIRLAENTWQELQSITSGAPEQSYGWAKAWTRCNSHDSDKEIAIVCGRSEAGEVLFLWPFDVVTQKGLRCLQWMGQSCANHNMGLHTLEFSRGVTASDVKVLLGLAAEITGDVSAAIFKSQPVDWNGIPNPLRLLTKRPSANQGHMLLLESDYDTLYRNRFSGKSRNALSRKARKLDKLGKIEFGWARSDEERFELLDELYRIKSLQLGRRKFKNPIDEENVHRALFRDIASQIFEEDAVLESAYLKLNGNPIAISSGIFYGDTFSLLLSSHDDFPARSTSPDMLLLHYQIEEACRRGLTFFNMGAGDAGYKSEWCDINIPLFDSAIAFEERGYLLTMPLVAGAAFNRLSKTTISKLAS